MTKIPLNRQPVELFKLLKFAGLAASGGEAKALISDQQVRVNNEIETRKRRKLKVGDLVEYEGQQYQLVAGW